MLAGVGRTVSTGSGPMIAALAVILVGAIAFAVPPAPIEVAAKGAERGMLVSHSRFSDKLAAQLARNGYTYLAIDLTHASLDEHAHWREHLRAVGQRQFPVWGWIDVRGKGLERARQVAKSVSLAGLFVYGPGVANAWDAVARPGLTVVPVLRKTDPHPRERTYAVILEPQEFGAGRYPVNVLLADRLDVAEIATACADAEGHCLVATVAIR